MHTGRLDSLGTNIKCASQVVLVVKNPPASSGCFKRHRFDPWVGKMSGGSVLAWSVSWTEEPGRLQSIGSQRVEHDWSDLACIACNIIMVLLH